jgi:hypothetical protein
VAVDVIAFSGTRRFDTWSPVGWGSHYYRVVGGRLAPWLTVAADVPGAMPGRAVEFGPVRVDEPAAVAATEFTARGRRSRRRFWCEWGGAGPTVTRPEPGQEPPPWSGDRHLGGVIDQVGHQLAMIPRPHGHGLTRRLFPDWRERGVDFAVLRLSGRGDDRGLSAAPFTLAAALGGRRPAACALSRDGLTACVVLAGCAADDPPHVALIDCE